MLTGIRTGTISYYIYRNVFVFEFEHNPTERATARVHYNSYHAIRAPSVETYCNLC